MLTLLIATIISINNGASFTKEALRTLEPLDNSHFQYLNKKDALERESEIQKEHNKK